MAVIRQPYVNETLLCPFNATTPVAMWDRLFGSSLSLHISRGNTTAAIASRVRTMGFRPRGQRLHFSPITLLPSAVQGAVYMFEPTSTSIHDWVLTDILLPPWGALNVSAYSMLEKGPCYHAFDEGSVYVYNDLAAVSLPAWVDKRGYSGSLECSPRGDAVRCYDSLRNHEEDIIHGNLTQPYYGAVFLYARDSVTSPKCGEFATTLSRCWHQIGSLEFPKFTRDEILDLAPDGIICFKHFVVQFGATLAAGPEFLFTRARVFCGYSDELPAAIDFIHRWNGSLVSYFVQHDPRVAVPAAQDPYNRVIATMENRFATPQETVRWGTARSKRSPVSLLKIVAEGKKSRAVLSACCVLISPCSVNHVRVSA